jgi:hypothetical protein
LGEHKLVNIVLEVAIARAALKRGEEYLLRDWLYLREAGNGTGHCRRAAFSAFLKAQGFGPTQIAEITHRLLRNGLAERRFTGPGHHEVLMPLSKPQMLDRYGLGRSTWRVDVPLADLKGKGLRRRLFAYVEAGMGNSPIARSSLRRATGVSKSTQIRGEKCIGTLVQPQFVRVEPDQIEKMPCVAEGHHGHRCYLVGDSIYLQTANAYSHPAISRRKRVVRGSCSHCGDKRALQPTSRRRYFTDFRRASKKRTWIVETVDGLTNLPVLVRGKECRLGGYPVGVWELV